MQQVKVAKVRENIKPAYNFKTFGQFFVHGLTFEGDPTEHEYHSKTNTCKVKAGEIQFVTIEVKNNVSKIKLEKAPDNAPQATQPTAGHIAGPESNQAVWLNVFNSICILKSGTPTSLDDVLKAADKAANTNVPK